MDEITLVNLKKYVRAVGMLLLAGLTVYGFRGMSATDASSAAWWLENPPALAAALGFAVADTLLDGVCWVWIYRKCR